MSLPWKSALVFDLLGLEKHCKEFLGKVFVFVTHSGPKEVAMWHRSVIFWPSFKVGGNNSYTMGIV